MERNYGKILARRTLNRMKDLTIIIEAVTFQKGYAGVTVDDFKPIKRNIRQFISIYSEMGYKNTLTTHQNVLLKYPNYSNFYQVYCKLRNTLKKCN